MTELVLLDKTLLALINTIAVALGVWVYFSGKDGPKTNKYFALVTLSMLLWINAGYFLTYSTDSEQALNWARIAPASVLLFFILFYSFSLLFPKEQKRNKILDLSIIAWSSVLAITAALTPLIVETVEFESWGVNPIFTGWGRIMFYVTVLAFICLIVFNLSKNYLTVAAETRVKVQYLLLGFLIFIGMNFVFNVIFPLYKGTIQYWQFGNYSAIFLLMFTAYAIVKKKLFNIKTALTSLIVALIAILLAVEFFALTGDTAMRALKGATLLIFLVLSVVLFRVMNNEARQKEELLCLTQRMERANRELRKLDHAKSEFLSVASHQLRTPLTAMRGYLSMMLQGDFGSLSPKVEEVSQEVYRASLRLLKLSNDLLNVSQIEAGKATLQYEKTAIGELISSVVHELQVEAEKKGLYLKLEKDGELSLVEIDKDKIRQVILNIVDNAIRYTEKGGITVKTEKVEPDKVLIKIKDTGAGLDKKDISKLFQSFSRGQAGSALHSAGTGLGLYVARKFVDQHGGRIRVKSSGKDKGSTFFIELPVKKPN